MHCHGNGCTADLLLSATHGARYGPPLPWGNSGSGRKSACPKERDQERLPPSTHDSDRRPASLFRPLRLLCLALLGPRRGTWSAFAFLGNQMLPVLGCAQGRLGAQAGSMQACLSTPCPPPAAQPAPSSMLSWWFCRRWPFSLEVNRYLPPTLLIRLVFTLPPTLQITAVKTAYLTRKAGGARP